VEKFYYLIVSIKFVIH